MRPKKTSFLPGFNSRTAAISHGGEHTKGKRKTFRPIDPKQALHVVLRSSVARGEYSMLHSKHCNHIEEFTRKLAKHWGVRLYRYANVGNHLHLLLQVPSRAIWQRFIRELAGGIPMLVTGARKGMALSRADCVHVAQRVQGPGAPESAGRGFWDHLVFSRIVSFGRDFAGVARYLIKNLFEAAGVPMKKLLAQGYRIADADDEGLVLRGPPLADIR